MDQIVRFFLPSAYRKLKQVSKTVLWYPQLVYDDNFTASNKSSTFPVGIYQRKSINRIVCIRMTVWIRGNNEHLDAERGGFTSSYLLKK